MSESSKKAEFSSLLISGCLRFCFYIFSHPLYFSYLLYFTPYILKLLSFLTPLFLTCALLFLALLTASPNKFHSELCNSHVEFLVSTCELVLEQFSFNGAGKDEDFGYFVQLEAFKIMLETFIFESLEPKYETDCSHGPEEEEKAVLCSTQVKSNANLLKASGDDCNMNLFETDGDVQAIELKTLQSMFKEETGFEDERFEQKVQEVKPLDAELNKVEVKKEKSSRKGESNVIEKYKHENSQEDSCFYDSYDDNEDVGYACKAKASSQRHEATVDRPSDNGKHTPMNLESNNIGSFGSMRKEKEWRRTLACKLFEERHNMGGGEGMDMLWETYDENESNKVQPKSDKQNGKKGEVEYSEEDEDEDVEGKLCCLQALKFSAGRVNLGMGKPNLMKISKALKGIGWLHVSKNGKKGRR